MLWSRTVWPEARSAEIELVGLAPPGLMSPAMALPAMMLPVAKPETMFPEMLETLRLPSMRPQLVSSGLMLAGAERRPIFPLVC
jgi:hypothetical protein